MSTEKLQRGTKRQEEREQRSTIYFFFFFTSQQLYIYIYIQTNTQHIINSLERSFCIREREREKERQREKERVCVHGSETRNVSWLFPLLELLCPSSNIRSKFEEENDVS